jgi:hypothetical protein
MKLVYRLLNSGWFHVLAASFGWIIHGPCGARSAKSLGNQGRQAGPTFWWGRLLYAVGIVCGLVGIGLNFSGRLPVGTWLIGVAITVMVSTALQLGHLKKW